MLGLQSTRLGLVASAHRGSRLPAASLGSTHLGPGSAWLLPPCPCPSDHSSNQAGWPEFYCYTLPPGGCTAQVELESGMCPAVSRGGEEKC